MKKNKMSVPKKTVLPQTSWFGTFITGNFLNKTQVVQQFPFMFFICFLLIAYLIYDFRVEKRMLEIHQLEKEVQQLQLHQITIQAELSKEQLYSRIVQRLQKNQSAVSPYHQPHRALNVR